MSRFLARLAALIVLIIVVAGAAVTLWLLAPGGKVGTAVFVEIERGMSSQSIAAELKRDGIVRSPWSFLLIRALHPSATLQAGEYRFTLPVSPSHVFDVIHRGEIFYEQITVPEGSNIFDIARLLDGTDTISGKTFLKTAADPASIRDLDNAAPNLEGFLFPSTYRVTHKTSAAQLCKMMTDEFRREWAAETENAAAADVHRTLTLASLVEKESAGPAERPLIAGLFENRLRLHMPLQCDPTTVYAALIENRYSGVIHRSDLASANPYNTYAHPGLPPGPICNPGLASLKAALAPAASDFLYFVAKPDGSGSHQFSATLEQHQRAVLAYRQAAPR